MHDEFGDDEKRERYEKPDLGLHVLQKRHRRWSAESLALEQR